MKEYKRLTKRYKDGTSGTIKQPQSEYIATVYDEQLRINNEVLDRLCELEDKIENGTLIELPCKVGDEIYHLSDKKISKETVKQIKYIIDNGEIDLLNSYIMTDDIYSKDYNFYRFSKFGKSIFLTKTEAENRLKELKSND